MDRFDRHPRHGWSEKQSRFRAVFYFSRRHCLEIESLADLAAWRGFSANNYPPKGRKPVRGAKEWHTEAKDAPRGGR